MNAADRFGHRFELSAEGALCVMPSADSEHAAIVSRLIVWLAMAGWPGDRILQSVGIKLAQPVGDGGRIPDLTVWSTRPGGGAWLPQDGLLLVVEVVSPSSAAMDEVVKVREYAAAGIPRYWLVERDAAQTVTLHALGADGVYAVAAKMPLAWLLQTTPADHQIGG